MSIDFVDDSLKFTNYTNYTKILVEQLSQALSMRCSADGEVRIPQWKVEVLLFLIERVCEQNDWKLKKK